MVLNIILDILADVVDNSFSMKTLKAIIKSAISPGTFPLSFERLSYCVGAFYLEMR